MSLRSSSQQPPTIYISNAIGYSRESNPSRRICHLRAVPLGHVADMSHNFTPASCIASVITPTVKNKQGDAGVSSNYGPITVASVISKLLDHIILSKITSYLVTVDNQFGFKERHSTDMCVFLLK